MIQLARSALPAVNGTRAQPVVLPQPQRLILRNFSLYQRRRTIEVDFERDVFCLAGANGLGKSTFLAALSYAMTGTVARPGLNFLGASDYYEDLLEYSSRYFDGRINGSDHDIAEAELELRVGEWQFRVVRGMFDPKGLRQFELSGPEGSEDFSGPEYTDLERHERYTAAICKATHLSEFAQLVFLQLVVLTFDEQRRLTFWTPRVIEQALFLAFGVSADTASRAEALQRTYDSAESLARNLQWQATGRRKRLEALRAAMGEGAANDRDLRDEHVRLDEALESAGQYLAEAESARDEAETALNDAAAHVAAAQGAYEQLYAERVAASRSAHLHPVITEAIEKSQCAVCGAHGESVVSAIQDSLQRDRCPLCDSPLDEIDPNDLEAAREELRTLGERVLGSEERERAARAEFERRRKELVVADARVRELSAKLEEFRQANSRALLRASGEEGMIEEATRGLQQEINDLLAQKDRELARRDAAQVGLDQLRDELTGRFADMEHEFVPLLDELATEFLGLPLQVDLVRRGSRLGLTLSFEGSERRSPDALSESQRFFIDIALRMALARKLASAEPATLYVDTPEGSLDIAYEMRAGRMFGRFARGNGASTSNRLIMTANINTSQLLQELASVCGREHMDLVRMTEWTQLSDVQLEAEELFESAYSAIEERLTSGPR